MRTELKVGAAGALSLALLGVGAVGAVAQDASPAPVDMAAASGETYTLTFKELDGAAGYIYCEIIFDYGDAGQDIFSTSPVAPCDTDWWDSLDVDATAAELGANFIYKNGPEWWSSDVVAVMASEPQDIQGVQMNFGAVLPPGTVGGGGGTPDYTLFNTAKNQNLTWSAGTETYQLVDGNGYHYIIQGYKVDPSELPTLGDQFQNLPAGWTYETITYDQDLAVELSPAGFIPSVQDEFDQIYILIPTDSMEPEHVNKHKKN